jgi:putative phosphoribosyl transferase
VLAVPVAPADTLDAIRSDVDEIICLETPDFFYAIGAHYIHFGQVPDEEVVLLLAEANHAFSEKAAEPEDHEPPES